MFVSGPRPRRPLIPTSCLTREALCCAALQTEEFFLSIREKNRSGTRLQGALTTERLYHNMAPFFCPVLVMSDHRPSQHPVSHLSLTVQYALRDAELPTRAQLKRWVRAVGNGAAELTMRFVDSGEGRSLNATWRGRDYATNVLSFPYETEPVLTGDLVLCWPVVKAEAAEQGKSVEAHAAHLVVHGLLHLCGHDHEEEAQALEMERLEQDVMAKLGYPDPYQ
jgi:probable rRNA maturation factor